MTGGVSVDSWVIVVNRESSVGTLLAVETVEADGDTERLLVTNYRDDSERPPPTSNMYFRRERWEAWTEQSATEKRWKKVIVAFLGLE